MYIGTKSLHPFTSSLSLYKNYMELCRDPYKTVLSSSNKNITIPHTMTETNGNALNSGSFPAFYSLLAEPSRTLDKR